MATAQAPFPPKGSLKRFPFPRLLREIAREKQSGSLYLLNGQTKKVVFFDEGRPVFVRSNVLSECLGRVLSAEGLITPEQCEQTLEAIRRTGKKQGELLVEMGILSEGNLRYGLESQLRTKLFEIFSWDDGRFQFKPDKPDLQFGIKLDQSPEGVIIGAIQDRIPEAQARTSLASAMRLHPKVSENLDEIVGDLDLLPEEQYFARCLDGSRTVETILETKTDPPVPTPAPLLLGLIQAGVVELLEEPASRVDPPAKPTLGSEEDRNDDELAPGFEAFTNVTEYEDTPLPGELPSVRGLLGEHDDGFDEVEDEPSGGGTGTGRVELPAELVAAEPESVEETFDDDIELTDDEVEIVDDKELLGPDLVIDPSDFESDFESGEHPSADDGSDAVPAAAEPAAAALRTGAPAPAVSPAPAVGPAATATARPNGAPDYVAFDPTVSLPNTELVDFDQLDDIALPGVDEDLADEAEFDGVDLPPLTEDFQGDAEALSTGTDEELVDFDELDDIDLDGGLPEADENVADSVVATPGTDGAPVSYRGAEATMQDSETDNPEMLGAIRFNEAETALQNGNFSQATRLLDEALGHGFDVAELHAMLAYARFMASGRNDGDARSSFELLDYAQSMDPSLDLVHAYRGAIYAERQQVNQAKEALGRALELNPYCELAMSLMDNLRV